MAGFDPRIRSRGRSRSARSVRRRRGCASASRTRRAGASSATLPSGLRRRLGDLAATASARARRGRPRAVLRGRGALYDGPWSPSATRRSAVHRGRPRRAAPGHPRHHRDGARDFSAADAFAGQYRLARSAARLRADLGCAWTRWRPDVPRPPHARRARRRSARAECQARHLHQLRQPARPLRARRAGPISRRRPPAGVRSSRRPAATRSLAALGAALPCGRPGRRSARHAPQPSPPARPTAPGRRFRACRGRRASLRHGVEQRADAPRRRASCARCPRPDYRLYALAGGPPRRPGLLRVADGQGASIDTEVWALSTKPSAAFVAGDPGAARHRHPATCRRQPAKGFIVEAEAIAGAEDISRFGGWRASSPTRGRRRCRRSDQLLARTWLRRTG